MNILFAVQADQIEPTDQIVVDGDHIEVKSVEDDPNDDSAIIVRGWSHDEGDMVEYPLCYDDDVDVWSL